MEQTHQRRNTLIFLLIAVSVMGGFFLYENFKYESIYEQKEQELETLGDTLDEVEILAKALSVYDVEEGREIYSRNSREQMPLASLVKTMTIITAMSGTKPDEQMYISNGAIRQFGDYGLFANEKWKKSDLVKLTLLASANDGAYALAETKDDFLGEMNMKARRIGMEQGLFLNSTGLDIKSEDENILPEPGVFGSALDANLMAVYALKAYPDLVASSIESELSLTSDSGFKHDFKNTNLSLGNIPNLLFSKTGYTDLAGGNLTVIFENAQGKKLAVTVLGSTMEGRFTDMEKIVDALYNANYEGGN